MTPMKMERYSVKKRQMMAMTPAMFQGIRVPKSRAPPLSAKPLAPGVGMK